LKVQEYDYENGRINIDIRVLVYAIANDKPIEILKKALEGLSLRSRRSL